MTTTIKHGHVLEVLAGLPAGHVQCCATSPPFFGLRSYGTEPQIWGGTDPLCQHDWGKPERGKRSDLLPPGESKSVSRMGTHDHGIFGPPGGGRTCSSCFAWLGELGQEPLPDCLGWARGEPPEACQVGCFIDHLRLVMAGLRRVLRDDGLCFVELADSYSSGNSGLTGASHGDTIRDRIPTTQPSAKANPGRRPVAGMRPKSLLLVPERFRLAMLADGWVVRSVVRWAKKAPMPESCRDRFTSAVSEVVMLSKGSRYYSDMQAVAERSETRADNGWLTQGDTPYSKALREQNRTAPLGTAGVKADGTRNPRNYAFLDPDDDPLMTWTQFLDLAGLDPETPMPLMNEPNYRHLSPEPSKLSHYASFGPKAIAPFLRLSTSERGACAECGAAWERSTVPTGEYARALTEAKSTDAWGGQSVQSKMSTGNDFGKRTGLRVSKSLETTGWRPRCQCQAETVPCRTLDCFGGSGTVGVVSEKLGLDCTLIDLSPDYVGMAALRLQLEGAPLFATNGHDDRAGGLEQAVMALEDGR